MSEKMIILKKNLFAISLCFCGIVFFEMNWWLVFHFFAEHIADGFWYYLVFLSFGVIFLLSVLFLEKKQHFSWLIFFLGNLVGWLFFSWEKNVSFFNLFFFSALASLFFFSGRKIFHKETENQIKIQPVVSLRKPYRGLTFALAFLFASAFYFISFDQINNTGKNKINQEKMFVLIMEDVMDSLKKISPNGQILKNLNLDSTIDEYIKKNLPPMDQSMLGKQVQLPDGTITVYNQALLDEMEKTSLIASREQLSNQFGQNLTGQEKLYQVVGMIMDQKVSGFTSSFRKVWPSLSPILLIQALSIFFFIVWLGGLLRFLETKMVDWLLKIFIGQNWVKKEKSLVEKEEIFF